MSKESIVNAVAAKMDCTKAEAGRAVDAVAASIHEVVGAGAVVRLAPLGLFKRVDKAARIGRNPKTGEPLKIPAKSVITLKASKA